MKKNAPSLSFTITLHLPLLLLLLLPAPTSQEVPDQERNALIDFYNSLAGQNWTENVNWLTGDPCDNDWVGVHCNSEESSVLTLIRQKKNLVGTLPSSLSQLTQLTQITLTYNPKMVGTIPPFYVGHEALETIALPGNGFSGALPSMIGSVPTLRTLSLTQNFFTGSIPLDMLTGSLSSLSLSENFLNGTLPHEVCDLTAMEVFQLGTNFFSGTLPGDCFAEMKDLMEFSVYFNSFSGSIPLDFCKLPHLEYLWLFDNQFSGTVPDCIGNSGGLTSIDWSSNQISGALPELDKLVNLSSFNAAFNQMSGTLPKTLPANLLSFSLSSNYFSGSLPEDYGLIPNFQSLYAQNNTLTGSVPEWGCGLVDFRVEGNFFDCPLPTCCIKPEIGANTDCGQCQ